MHALLDGDIVAFRTAAVCETEDAPLAIWQANEFIKRVLSDVNADTWQIYLTGDNNFRYKLYPDYKANRRDKPKPKHLEAVKEFLVSEWTTIITDGYEADDALGIALTENDEAICCSIDKDLLQIPGRHYHFVNRGFSEVLENEGWKTFYTQLLIGDAVDNIPGCPGIGKVKAPKILEYCETPFDMYEACRRQYELAKVSLDKMHLSAQLLYILRRQEDEWKPPLGPVQQEPAAAQ